MNDDKLYNFIFVTSHEVEETLSESVEKIRAKYRGKKYELPRSAKEREAYALSLGSRQILGKLLNFVKKGAPADETSNY